MKMMYPVMAALAVAGAVFLMAGCEADPSAPTRPKTANLLPTPKNAADNAEKRENEKVKPELPATGSELPDHSMALPVDEPAKVITADAASHNGSPEAPLNGVNSRFPETKYPAVNWYPALLPQLPANPGTTPMTGSTPVPGTRLSIDHSWGQGLTLVDYPHRDWSEKSAPYVAANVKHNPVYFSNLQPQLNMRQNSASYADNWLSNLLEIPWAGAQAVALPVLMVLECPFKQVTTQRLGHDPAYLGFLSTGGSIVPSPVPGVIKWDYPFLRVNPNSPAATQPTTEPIAGTPGITPAVPATAPAELHEVETRPPDETPGLR